MYDGEGEVAWLEYLDAFLSMLHEEYGCSDEQANLLLAHTLRESPHRWLLGLPANNMHSLEKLCDIIEDTFYHFDIDIPDRKLLYQWKALHESVVDFWQRFHDLLFQAPRS